MKSTNEEVVVKMILDRWFAQHTTVDQLFSSLTDEQLMREISPGRNRGIYLLGHLIAVHEKIAELTGMGEAKYPELYDMFVTQPDKTVADLPSLEKLRASWKDVYETLNEKFKALPTAAWFEKHTAVSEEDFAKEPHRNKLNILLTRTTHLSYHWGQLVLLKDKPSA